MKKFYYYETATSCETFRIDAVIIHPDALPPDSINDATPSGIHMFTLRNVERPVTIRVDWRHRHVPILLTVPSRERRTFTRITDLEPSLTCRFIQFHHAGTQMLLARVINSRNPGDLEWPDERIQMLEFMGFMPMWIHGPDAESESRGKRVLRLE